MISLDQLFNASILIVDDRETNTTLLRVMLENVGYCNITTTCDPHLVQTLNQEHQFDIILLDICMPEMDGFEVIEQLKENIEKDYLPVLVITALADEETRVRALECGAKDFILKPFNRVELINRVRNILEVRLLHNQVLEQNANLEQQVRERTAEIRETRLEIVRRLGYAAEHRDNETGLHIIRMSQFAELLAKANGCDEEYAEVILHTSPMHDIGKLGIPDSILQKPGKLDADEWEVMKTHTVKGAEILEGPKTGLLKVARKIALYHHEKWDGTGYPHQLVGEEIPLEARIVAVADVFDALTSKRPYKEAWPLEKALEEIKALSGSHFDPTLVNQFLSIIPDAVAIMERHAEPG